MKKIILLIILFISLHITSTELKGKIDYNKLIKDLAFASKITSDSSRLTMYDNILKKYGISKTVSKLKKSK